MFVAIEIASRRILHVNITNHPTAEWTRQQFREFVDDQSGHRYVIHDRDTVFSAEVDEALKGFGLEILKTPIRSPMANAYCERVIGTIRRECLVVLAAVFLPAESLKLTPGERVKGMGNLKFLRSYSTNACSATPFPTNCGTHGSWHCAKTK